MPDTGTLIPLPPSAKRLEEAQSLEQPQRFVPETTAVKSQSRPTAVLGELGASFTVFEANWTCEDCQTSNAATKPRCVRCRARKPPPQDASATEETAATTTSSSEWKEVFDPKARHIYYHNIMTGTTQWERPAEMGPSPHASGWYGRGAAGSTAAGGYEANNEAYLRRPARKQVEYIASKNTVLEGAYEYNIYWGKYVGDHWAEEKGGNREPAETRCVLATDAGHTKADKMSRARSSANFCLFFARGSCALGVECRYFHRIPVRADLERFAKDESHDCFGRERHKEFRDDMTGVGAILKPCRTLYVGNLVKAEYADPAALEETLWRHFGEWGELENVNLVSRLSIAFVRYRHRSSAEFAKEAMGNNHLDHGENLCIRWAHDDPNPVAADSSTRADADALVNMLKAHGAAVDGEAAMASFDHPADYHPPKRTKLGSDYPDTAEQYPSENAGEHWEPVVESDGRTYWWNTKTNETSTEAPPSVVDANSDRAMAALDAADHAAAQAQAQAAAAAEEPLDEPSSATPPVDHHNNSNAHEADCSEPASLRSGLPPGWAQTVDPATGATYFYNAETRATSWTRPEAAATTA